MAYFSKTTEKITPENYFSKVKSITVRICITNCSGTIYVTDLLLQPGSVATGWVGIHPTGRGHKQKAGKACHERNGEAYRHQLLRHDLVH